jgi:hypothetical protein
VAAASAHTETESRRAQSARSGSGGLTTRVVRVDLLERTGEVAREMPICIGASRAGDVVRSRRSVSQYESGIIAMWTYSA